MRRALRLTSILSRRHFNPRTLQESATSSPALKVGSLRYFNPRTLQESATFIEKIEQLDPHLFQSTHPTRECDSRRLNLFSVVYISIHAPYKRVRPRLLKNRSLSIIISIHAPYKRVRPTGYRMAGIFNYISIHAPYKRVRHRANPRLCGDDCISIHAPYKRVRQWSKGTYYTDLYFNPRTLQESATGCTAYFLPQFLIFQSTHPTRECDLILINLIWCSLQFQSTHPTRECD